MRRTVDLQCSGCETERLDQFLEEAEVVSCPTCGMAMEQIWWKRRAQRATCWDEGDSIVVFENPNPYDKNSRFSFPARNDKPLPPGWIKHVARSDREVGKLERMTGTLNQDRWFDRNGNGFESRKWD